VHGPVGRHCLAADRDIVISPAATPADYANKHWYKEIDMSINNRSLIAAAALIVAPALIVAGTATANAGTDLRSLVPTPASTQRTDGPTSIQESGINEHFLVNGAPGDVMNAYQTALQGQGWTLTVANNSGGGGGGGATFTGTNGGAYGVFTGGGYGNTTDIQACAWPTKPSNTDCGQRN
jgi:hypothetical protein